MQDIFLTVINMNVTALYIIVAVILLRLCLKKLPKRFSYGLWAIPALRLVCPFSIEAFFSLFNFLKPAKTAPAQLTYIPHDIGLMEKPEISTGIPALNRVINESLPAPAPEQSVNPMQIWVLVGTIVWLVGVAAMLLWLFASYYSVAVRVRGSRQTDEGLYICDKIDAPFVFGVIKPKIYIPADLPEKELIYIIAHEKAHIRRGDHIVKLIGAVILAVHWFNPAVWVAYKLMTKDMELSCDERALKGFETDVRKEYASALLSVSMKQNHLSRGGLLSFGESGIKSRIKSVLSFKKPALWVTVIAVAVLLVAGGCMLTNPISDGEGEQEIHVAVTEKPEETVPVNSVDNVDVGVEDSGEYVEIEVEDETQEYEAPASSESKVIARFKESDLSYDLSIFEKYFWGEYDYGWDITPMNYSNTNSLISPYFPRFAENDEIAVMQVYDGGEYNLYVMYKDDPTYIKFSGMVYGLGEENGEFNVVKTDRIIRKYDLEPDYSLKDGQKLNSLGYLKLLEITGNKDNQEAFYTQDIQDENGVDIWNYNGLTCRSFLKSLSENHVVLIKEHESLTDSPWSCFFEITFTKNGDKWDYTYEKCEDPELEEYQNNPYKGIYYDAEALIYYRSLTTMPFENIPGDLIDKIGSERFQEWLDSFDRYKLTTDIGEQINIYTFIRDFNIDDESIRNHCDQPYNSVLTGEQKEALLSRDKNRIAAAFVMDTAHYHDGNIYTIEWYYKNPVEKYKATGITYEELKEKYSKAMDWFSFTRPARKIFEQKLEQYKEIG